MNPPSNSENANHVQCISRYPTTWKQEKQSALQLIGQRKVEAVEQVVGVISSIFPPSPSDVNLLVESHLQTQRSAVKMLHERILILIKYVTDVIAGTSATTKNLLSTDKYMYL